MSELGGDPREVLAAYRRSTRIDATVRERAWARVQTTLAAPGAPTVSAESARGLQTWTWVASLAAAAAIAIVARGHFTSETTSEPAHRSAPMQASDRAPTTSPELVEDTARSIEPPEVAPEVAPDRPTPLPAPSAQQRSRPTRVEPTRMEPTRMEPTRGDLAREMQLLRDTRAALQREDSESALRHLETHAREFPQGQMAEERDYLRVEALCIAGYDERARQAADAFGGEHPASTHLDRVRAACSQ